MTMLSKVGTYEFLAEPFHCDFSNRLFIGHMGNSLLNAADFHSNDRGYGMHYLNTIHKTWVLSRLAIEITEMPKAYDRYTVETWVEGAMRYFTDRDFAIKGAGDKVYGYGRSVWAMIDTETRQPTDIMSINDGLINSYIDTTKPCPIDKVSRVKMGQNAEHTRSIQTYYSDVDINGHINSVKYIEHILNLWGLDFYKSNRLKRFDIAYVAESHYGDLLHLYVEEVAAGEFCVQVMKQTPDAGEELKEVCRCKVKFVAK